jgi:hypothetical protein
MSYRTANGTVSVSNLSFPYHDTVQAIANVSGWLFFQADDGVRGFGHWMNPAERHERGGHHHGADDDVDGAHPLGGDGEHGNAVPDALTSEAPTVATDRPIRGVPSAPPARLPAAGPP